MGTLTPISTYELLLKPIAPGGSPAARNVVQGYFLTISNLNSYNVVVELVFTASSPSLNLSEVAIIKDVFNVDQIGTLTPINSTTVKYSYNLFIPAQDTALVTLLPVIPQNAPLPLIEVRGYVEISVLSPSTAGPVQLLLTPEHRGTFLPKDQTSPTADFDQLAYALPTSNGGSLFKL
jgi:hypothetical protein